MRNLQRSWFLDAQTNAFKMWSYLIVRIFFNSNKLSIRLKWAISSVYNLLERFLGLTLANDVLCRDNIKFFSPVDLSILALNRDVVLGACIFTLSQINGPGISFDAYNKSGTFTFTIHFSVIPIFASKLHHSFSFDVTKEVEVTRQHKLSIVFTLSDWIVRIKTDTFSSLWNIVLVDFPVFVKAQHYTKIYSKFDSIG